MRRSNYQRPIQKSARLLTLIIYSAASKPHDVTVEIPLITPHGGGYLLPGLKSLHVISP